MDDEDVSDENEEEMADSSSQTIFNLIFYYFYSE